MIFLPDAENARFMGPIVMHLCSYFT